MPYIEPRRNQNGIVTSYRLVVSAGLDQDGKQIRRRSIWTPPSRDMSEAQMEREATAAAYKFEDQIKKGYSLDNNQTFAEYAQYVMDLKERIGVKTSTMDRYLDMLPRINGAIGHLKLCNIRPQHLNDFYKDMMENAVRSDSARAVAKRALATRLKREKISKAELGRRAGVAASTITAATRGNPLRIATAEAIANALKTTTKELFTFQDNTTPLSSKTILEHHRLISTILGQADKELLIPFNPAEKATPPKVKRSSPDYYQPDEMDEILNALENAPIKWKAITYLLIDTGCRRGEIMGLKWDRVNFETGVITIDSNLLYSANIGIYEDTTKTGEVRAIKIAPQTLEVLRKWKKVYDQLKEDNGDRWANAPYVFVRDDGSAMHPDSITDWLRNFSKKYDLPHIHPHAFRHTAASTMIANGVDLVTTAAELGHARYAICNNCGGVLPWEEQYTYKEIMPIIGAGSETGAEKACNTALKKLIKQLAEDNAIRVLDYERIKPEPNEKKAAAAYRYQADCDGEWGEIYFDFEKNTAEIRCLAEWDTSKSHLYAQRVILRVLPTGGKHLPKKNRIVFER